MGIDNVRIEERLCSGSTALLKLSRITKVTKLFIILAESLDIERFHFRRAILDLEQVAPLVDGGGAPPNVYNRWRVRLES